ncbi:MAG: hypothetical protein WBC70_14605 [Candidatus Aminicenantales bacterium]
MKKVKRKSREDLRPGPPCCPSVPFPEPKNEGPFWPLPNSGVHHRVAHMLLLGLGPREIAELLSVPYGPFLKWYLDRGTQRYLMASQNEEAEKERRNAEENAE